MLDQFVLAATTRLWLLLLLLSSGVGIKSLDLPHTDRS